MREAEGLGMGCQDRWRLGFSGSRHVVSTNESFAFGLARLVHRDHGAWPVFLHDFMHLRRAL
jgi:hypothetical protein